MDLGFITTSITASTTVASYNSRLPPTTCTVSSQFIIFIYRYQTRCVFTTPVFVAAGEVLICTARFIANEKQSYDITIERVLSPSNTRASDVYNLKEPCVARSYCREPASNLLLQLACLPLTRQLDHYLNVITTTTFIFHHHHCLHFYHIFAMVTMSTIAIVSIIFIIIVIIVIIIIVINITIIFIVTIIFIAIVTTIFIIIVIIVRYFRMGAMYSTSYGRPTEAQFGQASSPPGDSATEATEAAPAAMSAPEGQGYLRTIPAVESDMMAT